MNKLHIIMLISALIFAPRFASAEFKEGGSDAPPPASAPPPVPVTSDAPKANDVNTISVADFIKKERLKSPGSYKERFKAVVESEFKSYTLQGNITCQLQGDLYTFKDETGSVTVEIDDFKGVKVGFGDIVRIVGEPDYDDGELALDVEHLELVK